MKKIIVSLVCLLVFTQAWSQQALFGGNDLVSPEVKEDGTVTFRLFAPKAVRVQLTGDFLAKEKVDSPMGPVERDLVVDLQEGNDGVWTYTTGSLSPELYSYKFIVDGRDQLDPSNVYMCRDIATYTNIFIIEKEAGDKGDLYSVNKVPHGSVSKVWYESPTLKMSRRMTVYTPPGYEKGGRYPVLYLLHGAGGDEEAWATLGRASQIMDNLIAMGKAKPMIVVMTNGNTNSEAAPGEGSNGMYKPSFRGHATSKPVASMEESFPDVVNYIEKNYRTLKGKKNRAICGLSMGGGHSFSITKRYPTMFDYVGLFSAAIFMGGNNDPQKNMLEQMNEDATFGKEVAAVFAANPKLYWIAIGNTDFLFDANTNYRKYLDSKGYRYEYLETDGGHIWRNWRIYLTLFAEKIFQ
ncbi:enterochelin esterase-like enzyme [Parabacteroides sp. PFB2-12]|uniref:esterase n=1 Tax=unclassified Parabacteroides TaxID=2649774 RepID=UPI00247320CC|nr:MULTISPECIES: esterase [unclassified Parabacteroides]MDH6343496.1 enterochelin esterase-like enzyme [Parabacteroides sp. PM6-13]MDH6390904.1 enterochelin esterase-like enzyme [Parabacteroides sp. PFB2-12]MDL2310063.1 esterase [Parabacteroides sp. OttesenSCG-928-B22]